MTEIIILLTIAFLFLWIATTLQRLIQKEEYQTEIYREYFLEDEDQNSNT